MARILPDSSQIGVRREHPQKGGPLEPGLPLTLQENGIAAPVGPSFPGDGAVRRGDLGRAGLEGSQTCPIAIEPVLRPWMSRHTASMDLLSAAVIARIPTSVEVPIAAGISEMLPVLLPHVHPPCGEEQGEEPWVEEGLPAGITEATRRRRYRRPYRDEEEKCETRNCVFVDETERTNISNFKYDPKCIGPIVERSCTKRRQSRKGRDYLPGDTVWVNGRYVPYEQVEWFDCDVVYDAFYSGLISYDYDEIKRTYCKNHGKEFARTVTRKSFSGSMSFMFSYTAFEDRPFIKVF
jgi:hypothetical protein